MRSFRNKRAGCASARASREEESGSESFRKETVGKACLLVLCEKVHASHAFRSGEGVEFVSFAVKNIMVSFIVVVLWFSM